MDYANALAVGFSGLLGRFRCGAGRGAGPARGSGPASVTWSNVTLIDNTAVTNDVRCIPMTTHRFPDYSWATGRRKGGGRLGGWFASFLPLPPDPEAAGVGEIAEARPMIDKFFHVGISFFLGFFRGVSGRWGRAAPPGGRFRRSHRFSKPQNAFQLFAAARNEHGDGQGKRRARRDTDRGSNSIIIQSAMPWLGWVATVAPLVAID